MTRPTAIFFPTDSCQKGRLRLANQLLLKGVPVDVVATRTDTPAALLRLLHQQLGLSLAQSRRHSDRAAPPRLITVAIMAVLAAAGLTTATMVTLAITRAGWLLTLAAGAALGGAALLTRSRQPSRAARRAPRNPNLFRHQAKEPS